MDIPDVISAADLVLIAIPDDAIEPLVSGLADLGAFRPGQIVAHTCGTHGVAILNKAQQAGALPIALHPAMTFTGTSIDVSRLVGTPFAVTAPAALVPIAQALVVELGGEPVIVQENDRTLYHAALAHGANHLVTLIVHARRMLEAAGVRHVPATPGRSCAGSRADRRRTGVDRPDRARRFRNCRRTHHRTPQSCAPGRRGQRAGRRAADRFCRQLRRYGAGNDHDAHALSQRAADELRTALMES